MASHRPCESSKPFALHVEEPGVGPPDVVSSERPTAPRTTGTATPNRRATKLPTRTATPTTGDSLGLHVRCSGRTVRSDVQVKAAEPKFGDVSTRKDYGKNLIA